MPESITAIVAHDAGAANHIIAWIKSGHIDKNTMRLSLSGPAKRAYSLLETEFQNYSLEAVLAKADTLISGTGWSSDVEHKARLIARKKSIRSIAVIDHWTNYEERFTRNEVTTLPDTIWVTDKFAITLAEQIFPKIGIELQPNDLLKAELSSIEGLNRDSYHCEDILFLMEPIRQAWGQGSVPGEIQAFEYFMKNRATAGISTSARITVKPHPSDPAGKYDHLREAFPASNISIDSDSYLSTLIANSESVIGCQTYAMVIALAAGKKVFSALPPHAPRCVLPHPEIKHLRDPIK